MRDSLIRVRDFAGVEIYFNRESLCIDVLEPSDCNYILYTHSHSRHTPDISILYKYSDKIYSLFYGNKISVGEELDLSGFKIRVVNAYSWRNSDYHPKGFGAGFIVKTDVRVYVTGDTDLVRDLIDEVRDRIDILIIPVEGLGVFTPEEAAELVKSLRPSITIPIHYTDASSYYTFRDIAQPYTQVICFDRKRSK